MREVLTFLVSYSSLGLDQVARVKLATDNAGDVPAAIKITYFSPENERMSPSLQAPLLKGLCSINFQGIFVSFRGSEIHLFT